MHRFIHFKLFNSSLVIVIVTACICVVLITNAQAADQDATETTEEVTQTPADRAFSPLQKRFQNIFRSLQSNKGISPENHDVIRALREDASKFSDSYSDDPRGIALELQLSAWLGEQDVVDDLYGRLIRVRPDSPSIRLAWAKRLVSKNRYPDALTALEAGNFDPSTNPEGVLTLSDCLFAQQRFQEALDKINSIPQEILDDDLQVKSQVDRVKPWREEYPDLWEKEQQIHQEESSADDLPRALVITSRGPIQLELFENHAPNTVANFVTLSEQGFYNGTKFHRVIPNFMAQGGDPNSKEGAEGVAGQGNPGYYIPDEHDREDHRKHFTGSLSMAKQTALNTGGCQFFMTHAPTPWLNGKHTVFGRVLEGIEVVRQIEKDDVIESVTVLRKRDHDYTPETVPLDGSTTQPEEKKDTPVLRVTPGRTTIDTTNIEDPIIIKEEEIPDE